MGVSALRCAPRSRPLQRSGRLSFLGFVWVQTFATSKIPLTDERGWAEFLKRCERTAEEFRKNGDRRLASKVSFVPSDERQVHVRGRKAP